MQCFSIFLNFSEYPEPLFEIQVKLALPLMSARWAGNPILVLVLGSHTLRAHPCIFPLFFAGVFLVALVQNWI
jgi:hypothetical protein